MSKKLIQVYFLKCNSLSSPSSLMILVESAYFGILLRDLVLSGSQYQVLPNDNWRTDLFEGELKVLGWRAHRKRTLQDVITCYLSPIYWVPESLVSAVISVDFHYWYLTSLCVCLFCFVFWYTRLCKIIVETEVNGI